MQQALARLHAATTDLGLTVNLTKTKGVKFKKGNRAAAIEI